MSRSFRKSDDFAETRARFNDRKDARRARVAEFAALGYDDPEAMAALPIHGAARRARALQALDA